MGIKAQDIVVLLKIVSLHNSPWRHIDLANELKISPSEVSMALERARGVGFLDSEKRIVQRHLLLEFLIHGLKYVFPAELGPMVRGVPTMHSAAPLSRQIVSDSDDQFVWPDDDGTMRGQSITPLYNTVPQSALKDPKLYELLALVDALRVGRSREKKIAAEEIERRLSQVVLASVVRDEVEVKARRAQMPVRMIDKEEEDDRDTLRFWLEQPVEARIDAMEFLRRQTYLTTGNVTLPRFQYVIQLRDRQ